MSIDDVLREELTPDQVAAAEDESAEVLGIACAGSGKSRTLAYRIASLIARGVAPGSIVAFTFTEKAADSIQQRVAVALARVGVPPTILGRVFIGTIHAYSKDVLCAMDARYRQYDVLDGNRLVLYLMSRYPRLGLRPLRARAGNRYFETLTKVASAWMTLNDEMIALDDVATHDQELADVLRRIQAGLDTERFIDFSLMIRLVAEALERGDPAALDAVAHVTHLLVDEYQDVNPAQEHLVRQLHTGDRTLFVVGDDDQAIYPWRGADVSNILDFEDTYPNCSRQTLAHNFRSTRAIVTAADAFIGQELGPTRLPKNPTATDPAGPRDFRVLWFPSRADEARWVADQIEALLGTEYVENDGTIRGLTPADFAILMRSTRSTEQNGRPRHAALTGELTARGPTGIAYTLEAGGGVFERVQVAVLRETFGLLRSGAPTRPQLQQHFDQQILPAYPNANFNAVARTMRDWARNIHTSHDVERRRVYPQQLLHELLAAFGLASTNFDAGVMADIGVFSRILQDVEAVYLSIDSAQRFGDILNFLGNVAERGYDSTREDVLRRPNAVTVSTVHKAKGLEFPVVFVVDVERNRFPGTDSRYDGWLPQQVMQAAIARGAYGNSRAEEARLFYTAVTRAERFLYVSGAEQLPGGRRPRRPSPFAGGLQHPEIATNPGLPAGLQSASPARRIDETIVPTTFSEIRYYLRCPRDYLYRHIWGFSPPITEMFGFGHTVHAAVGRLHQTFSHGQLPSGDDAENVARGVFHLKHVAPSSDPVNRPGPYERAADSAAGIVRDYAEAYRDDFAHERQVELAFEVPLDQCVISGSIDLLLRYDDQGNLIEARVVDFKTMEGGPDPTQNPELDWTELAMQVQLYAKGARDVLGEPARTGAVHLLKDGQRVDVPVDDAAVDAAVRNVEWAVGRIIEGDFPMRPHTTKCEACDWRAICPMRFEHFATAAEPPELHLPGDPDRRAARCFSECTDE
jgi:DNA helicase II / ATP-dependent DNA helicase PcrA